MRRALPALALLAAMTGAGWAGEKRGAASPGGGSGCAPALRSGCERQQASCRISCPPQWSTTPGAPAFTPNDRAGCTAQCLHRLFACLRTYGCG
jgi:hypothetical protein